MIIPINTNYTFVASFGSTRTGKTVQYQIVDETLAVVSAYTATGIVELGFGEYGLSKSFSSPMRGYIQFKDVTDNLVISDPITVVDDYLTSISNIFKIETGRWKIINNQMIIYDSDATTPIYTFDLKDSSGSPTEENPTERTPA
jgi:hypothetical protein